MQQLKSLSRTILGVLVLSHASLFNFAQAVEFNEPPCNDMELTKGSYCIDSGGELAIVTSSKSRESRLLKRGKDVTRHRHLSKRELNAYLKAQGVSITTNNDGDEDRPNRPTTRATTTIIRKKTIYRADPRVQAQADFDILKDFCGGLPNRITDRENAIKDIQAQIEAIDLAAFQKAEKDAYTKMLTSCRKDCIKLAMVKDGVCAMTPERLGEVLSKDDLEDPWLGLVKYYNGQARYTDIIEVVSSVDASKVCSRMLAKPECKAELVKSGFSDCEDGATWLAALTALQDAQKQIAELKAKQSAYAKNSAPGNCKVVSADDASKPHWDSCSTQCLEKGLDSCAAALSDAEIVVNTRPPYCPDCGVGMDGGGGAGGGGGACMMYGTCGVSKTAQIIGAIGGAVTPLGLGLMNMSMNNRSLAACTQMYAMQIQLSQNVGLPPTGPNCGGMGGMGGGFMGGMGMNGMGMGQMYNPMMGMNGLGINAGINFGMNPMMGMQGQMGMNPMMGMGQMYNPMMGQQMMPSPQMMGQWGMQQGMNPYGMQGQFGMQQNPMQTQMYNAQLQMQQNAYQQMAVQNSMMNGYNNGGQMYGMNNMYQSPYYGMSGSVGINPYNSMGQFTGGVMPNYGYGNYYNPMSMYGGAGAGMNFNAGVNFNMGM